MHTVSADLTGWSGANSVPGLDPNGWLSPQFTALYIHTTVNAFPDVGYIILCILFTTVNKTLR